MDIFKKALKAAEAYQNATGIKCILISASGERIETPQNIPLCTYCNNIKIGSKKDSRCSDTHLYGLYQAERFGGKYIYFCSLSLMHWVSPILQDGIIIGGLFCGPVLAYTHDDFLVDNILDEYEFTKSQKEDFLEYIKSLPYVDPARVSNLSELLYITSSYLSNTTNILEEKNDSIEQQSEINTYIQYIKTMECAPEHKQKYPIEKERELLRQISQADVEQIFGLNFHNLNEIHNFTTVEELSYWLSKIMIRFSDLVFSLKSIKHTDVIYKAVHYMNTHMAEKIILDDVAAEILLSPAYFSKIFKEQTNDNFTHYLNKIRIEKSKSLLRNTNIPLVDIAGMVGYEDQSYFSKVFKKITGSTPGKYRDTRGLIERNNQEIHN